MSRGEILYKDIWDHKPPGIYYIYLFSSYFGDSQIFIYKLINIFLGLGTLYFAFRIARNIFKKSLAQNVAVASVTFLLGSFYLEGNILNTENVFIFFSSLAVFFYLNWRRQKFAAARTFLIALIFGIGFLFKFQILFDAFFLLILIILQNYRQSNNSNSFLFSQTKLILIYIFGIILPIGIFSLFYFVSGNFYYLWEALILYNLKYSDALIINSYSQILIGDIPALKTIFSILITLFLCILFLTKKISRKSIFIILWTIFSFLAVKSTGKPYAHYLLQMVIPISLSLAFIINYLQSKGKIDLFRISLGLLFIYIPLNLFISGTFRFIGYLKPTYYSSGYLKIIGLKTAKEWNAEFIESATLIDNLSEWLSDLENREIFIYANTPWIFTEANLGNPVPYTVYFHMNDEYSDEVLRLLKSKPPELILVEDKWYQERELKKFIKSNYDVERTLKYDEKNFSLWHKNGDQGKNNSQ
jgi:hypothetical protein